MRQFHARQPVAFWLIVIAVLVALWFVLFIAGHGSVSGGSG